MSIKPVLSFRGVFIVAILLCVMGIASFAFSGRVLPQMLTEVFAPSAAAAEALPEQKIETGGAKRITPAGVKLPFGPNFDGIVYGMGDLPLFGFQHLRTDRIYRFASPTLLDLGSVNDFEPSWSPDGKKIVFVSLRDGPNPINYFTRQQYRNIYIMNADGTDQVRLGGSIYGAEYQPSYSHHTDPQDQRIVFAADYSWGGQASGIYSMDVNGNNQTLLTDASECEPPNQLAEWKQKRNELFPGAMFLNTPNYSPDDQFIIFGMGGGDGDNVYRINADGTGCTRIYTGMDNSYVASEPRYSPDGTKIALHHRDTSSFYNDTLRIIDATTGAVLQDLVPFDGNMNGHYSGSHEWDPSGSDTIVYAAGDMNPDNIREDQEIWTIDINSGFQTQHLVQGVSEGIRGIDWGVPSTVVPTLSMRINAPHPLQSGNSTTGTLYLASPAPAGGTTVALTALGAIGAITVPPSVVIPEGQLSVNFPITSEVNTLYRTAGVLATRTSPSIAQAQASVSLHPARPDLLAVSFTAPATTTPGTSNAVSWTVQNIGPVTTSGSGSYSNAVYFSTDAVRGADDIQVSNLTGSVLAPGASQTQNSTATIPGNRVPSTGQYYLIFAANSGGTLNEGGQFSNNQIVHPIQVNTPDLVVENLVVPAQVEPGTAYSLTFNIRNAGVVATSGSFETQIFFSEDNIAGNADDAQLLSFSTSASIAVGGVRPETRSVTIPALPARNNGPAFYYVKVDSGNFIPEGTSTGEVNNNTFQATEFRYRLPDLVVENLTVPALVETGTQYPLTFNIRNAGEVATNTTFTTQIYFSEDNVAGNADDAQLLSFNISTPIAVGGTSPQTRNVTIPNLPVRNNGPAFYYVKVDSGNTVTEGVSVGENNNIAFQGTQFEYRVADLQVPASSVASDVDTDTAFPLSWTTANTGNKATTANFVDRVYLSADQTVGGDTTLGSFTLTGGLGAGATADRIQNITIAYANIPASGTYYLLIQTDATGLVNEGVNEGNNVRVQPIYVRKALRPDLVVTNVTAPPTVFFDQTIQVQWTVTNNGSGPTNAAQWKDAVYIGTSPTSTSGATKLAEPSSITALNPGESYTATATVKVPRGISGAFHFIVRANNNGAVNEVSTTNNLLSSPVTVNVPPLPDLVVESVQAPDELFAGQEISVSYTIRNIGTNEAGGRKDRIYLSRDTTLSTSQDRLIFTSDSIYGPAAGQATTHLSRNRNGVQEPAVYINARVPSDAEGLWYVFVVTDYQNSVYEFTGENNNTGYDTAEPGSPMNILVTPPDLVIPTQPMTPDTVASGDAFPVEFTVRNQGAFVAGAFLYHAVYLSTNATFEASTDTLLGTFYDRDPFPPGAEHPLTLNVATPYCLPNGTYYLFAVADHNGRQFEFDPGFDAEANNVSPAKQITLSTVPPDLQVTNFTVPPITTPGGSVSVSWTVANTGSATTLRWFDRVYLNSLTPGVGSVLIGSFEHTGGLAAGGSYTETRLVGLPAYMQGDYFLSVGTDNTTDVPECGSAENNNSAQSSNFTVQNNLPDLVIDSVTAPASATVGDTFNVSWAGRNANQQMPPNSSSFRDTVYLSSDTNLSAGDIAIGSSLNNLILGAGQTYPQQANVTVGNVAPGTYYILVAADSSNNIYEGPNNSGFESNNFRASTAISLSAPAVDLTVGAVSMSAPQYSGTFRDFSWTVTNVGTSPTLTSSWSDYVILSRDSILDPSDTTLGYRTRSGALAGGANYVANASFFVPVGLTGTYTIFVVTDRNNSVVENNNANNTSTPLTINLTVPPPAELNITNITPPASANVGGVASFSWTVQNTGANPIEGLWRDTFYLSRDQFWDASDTLVGVRDFNSQFTSVPADGGTYTGGWSGSLPPVEEGTYYVIVRTDAQNRIRESNEANNVLTSVGTTTITVTQLTINTPFNTTLGNGAQMFFKYVTDPAETLVFSLDTDTPQRSNEAFTKFGTMVSRADYDFQSQRPGEGDQVNVVDTTLEGNYYSMVRTDLIPESFSPNFDKAPAKSAGEQPAGSFTPQNITVNAQILPFSIRQVSPNIGGNQGDITLLVEGAKFEQGASVKLVGNGGQQITPRITRVARSRIAAIFDLKNKTLGDYDVVVTNPNNETAQLENGFEIVAGTSGGHSLGQAILGPTALRGGFTQRVRYTFAARNDGLNDALAVPIIVSFPSNVAWELDRSNYYEYPSELLPPDAVTPLQIAYEFDGRTHLMLIAPIIRSRSSIEIKVDLTVPGSGRFDPGIAVMPPLLELLKDGPPLRGDAPGLSSANSLVFGQGNQQPLYLCYINLVKSIALTIINVIPGVNCADDLIAIAAPIIDFVGTGAAAALTDSQAPPFDITALGGYLISTAKNVIECAGKNIPWLKFLDIAYSVLQSIRIAVDCLTRTGYLIVDYFFATDPNDKLGPNGYGAERYVPVKKPMLYQIRFENVATATAPAARITITDVLPPTLDPRTVRLREIGFKQNRIVIPENQAFYQNRVQLGADLNDLQADILAGLDLVNNRVFWNIQAIDPQTGEAPVDPLLGILPPNNSNRDGEGYVLFTVEPTSTMPTGTQINNSASIVFDVNEPIITNVTENTLDSGIPSSQMAPLPLTSDTPSIDLSWSGTDDATGSGLSGFDVFSSESGAGYLPVFTNTADTSGSLAVKWGKTYRFYSLGRDNAGNVEEAPTQPDATIRILGGDTEGDVAPRPNGNDGTLDGDDLTQVRRFIAKLDSAMQYNEFQRADMAPKVDGGDGSLSVADVMQARRYVAGTDTRAEAVGPNTETGGLGNTIVGKSGNLLPREVKPITIIRNGNQIEVGIVLETQGDETGLGFGLNFDPAVLSNPVVNLRPIASGSSLTLNTAQVAAGKLGVLLDKAPNQPLVAGTNVLMTITFDIALGSPATTQITFDDDPIKREVVNGLAEGLNTTFSPGTINLLAPTSANVSISGRVLKADGTPIKGARLVLSGTQTGRAAVLSNAFGYFNFESVAVGQTYTIRTSARGYTFTPRTIIVTDEISGLEISPDP